MYYMYVYISIQKYTKSVKTVIFVYSLPSDFFDNSSKPSGGQQDSLGLASYSSDEEEEEMDVKAPSTSSLKSVQLSHPALPAG